MPLATAAPNSGATLTPLAATEGPHITKQPKGESHFVGESAVFVVAADQWSSVDWMAVSPSGREIKMESFAETFPDCTVMGETETTLTITNLNLDMSGWSFYCVFEEDGETTKSEKARLKVTEKDDDANNTGSGASSGSKSKRLRCPGCGSEVPRDLLDCPYCGKEIYKENELAYVEKDASGNIFYIDNTGLMYYNSGDRTSTYVDTNTNYTVFNDSGLIQHGNYQKEEKEREKEYLLNAALNGDVDGYTDYLQLMNPDE